MINYQELKPIITRIRSAEDTLKDRAIVREVLRPLVTDSVEEIEEKMAIYKRLFFLKSLQYEDAPYHKEIRMTYAEQIQSFLTRGVLKYDMIIIVGFRESAKTTEDTIAETYLINYVPKLTDLNSYMSFDAEDSKKLTMDLWNILSFSRMKDFYGDYFKQSFSRDDKKQSQTMANFTINADAKPESTYSAAGIGKTRRGNKVIEIDARGDIEFKRPTKLKIDDAENEHTVKHFSAIEKIERTVNAAISGLNQNLGFTVMIGNLLSNRGVMARMLQKYRDDPRAKIIEIPIIKYGKPYWASKYVLTDVEADELIKQGIVKKSIESLKKKHEEDFEKEFMNNPKRSNVYFPDSFLKKIIDNEEDLIGEDERDENGLLMMVAPLPNRKYIMAVDTATATGKDKSAATIYDITDIFIEEVASIEKKGVEPGDFAIYTLGILKLYNNADNIPERNYPGNEYIYELKKHWKNIYRDLKDVLGFHTNLKTKPDAFLKTKSLGKAGVLKVRSQKLFNQFMEYEESELNEIRDEGGGHYDVLMSAVIGASQYQSISEQISETKNYAKVDSRINDLFEEDGNNL